MTILALWLCNCSSIGSNGHSCFVQDQGVGIFTKVNRRLPSRVRTHWWGFHSSIAGALVYVYTASICSTSTIRSHPRHDRSKPLGFLSRRSSWTWSIWGFPSRPSRRLRSSRLRTGQGRGRGAHHRRRYVDVSVGRSWMKMKKRRRLRRRKTKIHFSREGLEVKEV